MSLDDWDLSALRAMWRRRREAVESVLRRADPRGMTRPARDPEERAWLDERGEGFFVEVEEHADEWRAYYERKYGRSP